MQPTYAKTARCIPKKSCIHEMIIPKKVTPMKNPITKFTKILRLPFSYVVYFPNNIPIIADKTMRPILFSFYRVSKNLIFSLTFISFDPSFFITSENEPCDLYIHQFFLPFPFPGLSFPPPLSLSPPFPGLSGLSSA